jgi:hypothetical protein
MILLCVGAFQITLAIITLAIFSFLPYAMEPERVGHAPPIAAGLGLRYAPAALGYWQHGHILTGLLASSFPFCGVLAVRGATPFCADMAAAAWLLVKASTSSDMI